MFSVEGTRCSECGTFVSGSGVCRKCTLSLRMAGIRSRKRKGVDVDCACITASTGASSHCSAVSSCASSEAANDEDGVAGASGKSVEWTPETCPETDSDSASSLPWHRFGPAPSDDDDMTVGAESTFDDMAQDSDNSSEEGGSVDSLVEGLSMDEGLSIGGHPPGIRNGGGTPHSLPVLSDVCVNCKRQRLGDIDNDSPFHDVELSVVLVALLAPNERRWMSFDIRSNGPSVTMCFQCQDILLKSQRKLRRGERKKQVPWVSVWPVYMWKILSNADMISRFGPDTLNFIPQSCHIYWQKGLTHCFPDVYKEEYFLPSGENSPQVVVDGTRRKANFLGILERKLLGEIKNGCNQYLIPNVLCPWGCCGYIHDSGSVSYDAIVSRFFPFLDFAGTISTVTEKARVQSARDDFLSTELDMHLYNEEWTVHPTVEFKAGVGPVVLTCDSHDGGTPQKYFHLPKTGCSLPSAHSDVLSHAVINAKVIHRTKAFRYSTTYQLNKCTGSYSGVECSHISENRHFDFISHLTDLNEARSYAGRIDIRGLVGRLMEQRLISEELADSYAERAQELFGDSASLHSLTYGATMITLYDAMKLQEMLSTHPISTINVDSGKSGCLLPESEHHSRTIRRQWPTNLIHIHPNDEFGARVHIIPAMQSKSGKDFRLLWTLCQCMLNIPCLWEKLTLNTRATSQWHGFVLSYLSKQILGQSIRDKLFRGDPFDLTASDDRRRPAGLAELLKQFCLRGGGPGYTYTDNDYCPSNLLLLLREEVTEGFVEAYRLPFCPPTAIQPGCSVVVLYRDSAPLDSPGKKVPLFFDRADATYELRMLVCTTTEAKQKAAGHKWDSSVWVRHGGGVFNKWWCTRRSPSHVPYKVDNLNTVKWEEVDIALYVRREDVSLAKYRAEYLGYIGGQKKASCLEHDVPFIITHTKSCSAKLQRCSIGGRGCKISPEYHCPVIQCKACICQKCFSGLSSEDGPFRVDATATRADRSVTTVRDDLLSGYSNGESSDDSQEGDSQVSSSIEGSVGSVYTTGSEASDGSTLSATSSDEEDNEFLSLPTGLGTTFGTGEFAPEMDPSGEDACHDGIVPTTLEGENENLIYGNSEVIGTSVLLNKCGTMLVRRDTQLQANRRERHMLERIASRHDIGTVPLVYLEGVLFPSVFWCLPHSVDGGVLGSMPTSLFCQSATRKRLCIASIADHAKARLKSIGSTASTDPRYLTFMFDSIANGALEGNDTRVVLSRGFEESMGPAGMRMRNNGDTLYTDTIDNRQCVHDLCASEREDSHDVFVTLTANQREHFGLKQIKCYIDDGKALDNYIRHFKSTYPSERDLSLRARGEIQRALQEASITLTVRNWMEIRKIMIQYLLHSPELPLGSKVSKIFVRDEYQGDAGNLSHLHLLAALEEKYSSVEGKERIHQVIRGFVDDIVTADEVPGYISEGLIDDWEDYERMKDQARRYLAHNCSDRCMRRTGPGENDRVCRVPDARYISSDITQFCEKEFDVLHSATSVQLMERLGLCQNVTDSGGRFIPNREFLQSKRIFAPVRHGEGNISPVVGRLFAATRSTMNIQICTSSGTSRYVVKYIVKIDENNYVVFSARQKNDNATLGAEKVFLCNTKVTSSAINEKKKLGLSRHRARQKGRIIACTEMIQLILGYPQVHCNMEFLRVPTLPLGERPGVERECPLDRFEKMDKPEGKDAFSVMVPTVMGREKIFKSSRHGYRLHTASQVAMLRDQMLSKVTLDRVFIFSIRPPELLFIDRLEWYYRIFDRSHGRVVSTDEPLDEFISLDLVMSQLIDGLGFRVTIRDSAIPLLKEVLKREVCTSMASDGYSKVKSLFTKLVNYHEADIASLTKGALREWEIMRDTFISVESVGKRLPIVVFSNVKPYNASKFIIHILLSMGHFVTERDVWAHASIPNAFVAAGLLNNLAVSRADVDRLLLRWIDDQLRYYPVSARKMDSYMVAADNILTKALLEDAIPVNELPPVMYASLVRETNATIERHMLQCKTMLVDATLKSVREAYTDDELSLPSQHQLLYASKAAPVNWNHNLPRSPRQSIASYNEQLAVQARAIRHIDTYCSASTTAAKNLLIAGPPGVGKTFCMAHSIIYCLSKGLLPMTTAMLADRAFMLGGRHLHMLFKLRVRDRGPPHRLAELAVISLQKKPELFEFIRRLDVLFVDECGQVSAELLSVLDIIVRKVRDSSLFMGGILVIGTIDQVQLQPIRGLPFLLSPYVLTTFSMVVLREYVRCSKCLVLQEINEICRAFPQTDLEWKKLTRRLRYLLSTFCTFVDSWDSSLITDSVLRIFPKREDANRAVKKFLDKKRAQSAAEGCPYLTVDAVDTMVAMESHADWKPASKQVTSFINSKVREPSSIDFYKGAIYQFTHNCPGRYNATQLGILVEVPTQEQLSSFEEISILVAPPGTKSIDCSSLPSASTPGWRVTKVGIAPQNPLNLWSHGVKAKRKQYALKHHIASTIHSAIGHTVLKIATELGLGRDLWEKAMVVVLVSRVSEASDLIFVGDKRANIEAIIRGLSVRSQYDDYMNHVVNVLSRQTSLSSMPLNLSVHPFRQRDVPIPSDTSGVVYLLVSIHHPSSIYIGFTHDMNKRLKQHNSGIGARASSDPSKRPWGLLAYVSGFQYSKSTLRQFELRWQTLVARVRPSDAFSAANLATTIIDRYYSSHGLQLVMSMDG